MHFPALLLLALGEAIEVANGFAVPPGYYESGSPPLNIRNSKTPVSGPISASQPGLVGATSTSGGSPEASQGPPITNTPERYMISFKDDATPEQKVNFTETLASQVPRDKMGAVRGENDEIVLVAAILDSNEIDKWKSDIVQKIAKDGLASTDNLYGDVGDEYASVGEGSSGGHSTGPENTLQKRSTPPIVDLTKGVDRRLKFISQKEGVSVKKMASYSFDSRAGENVNIYLPDSGLYQKHAEFDYRPGPLGYAQSFGQQGDDSSDSDPEVQWKKGFVDILPDVSGEYGTMFQHHGPPDPTGHGTCLASLAVGRNFGVAKAANFISSRIQVTHDRKFHVSSVVAAMWAIVRNIDFQRTIDADYIAIVAIAFDWHKELFDDLYGPLQKLDNLDVPVIIASGKDPEANPLPQNYAYHFSNIVVAVEVDIDGRKVPSSPLNNLPPMPIGAPTWAISARLVGNDWNKLEKSPGSRCAGIANPQDIMRQVGSSNAPTQIAAVMALQISIDPALRERGKVVERSIARLRKLSHPRKKGYPNAIWNGIEGLAKAP